MSISSDGIGYIEISRFGNKLRKQQRYSITPISNADQQTIHTLITQVMAQHSSQHYQQLELVLSSDFIRFLVLPAQSDMLTTSEKRLYAKALYQQVYGNLSDNWQIEFDDAPPNQATLCAAIDQSFIHQLQQLALQHRFWLTSITPLVSYLTNQLKLKRYEGYLVIIESSRIVLIEFKSTIQTIQQVKWQEDWLAPLKKLLTKTQLSRTISTNSVQIYAPMHQHFDRALFSDWDITLLKPISSLQALMSDSQFIVDQV